MGVLSTKTFEVDWGTLAPLRLRARSVAEGLYAGAHRSLRKGSGVEFGGHRPYVPGDDLRWLDHRALLRHDRLFVREFETETDRALRLVIDASASMGYRSERAPGAKLAFAALGAAVLARLATANGDPVGLDWIAGGGSRPLPAAAGREAFERVVGVLESVQAGGDLTEEPSFLDRALGPIARRARRGSIVVLFSDLLDLPPGALDRFAALASGGRVLVVVQVLDPNEVEFPFAGTVRLRALEGAHVVETEGTSARAAYLAALERVTRPWSERMQRVGGRFVRACTTDDMTSVVRSVIAALGRREGGEPQPE